MLIVFEIFSGTFYLLFLGTAAILVGLLLFALPLPGFAQAALFVGLSLVSIFYLKRKRSSSQSDFKIDQDQIVVLDVEIPPGQERSVMYQGTPWTARNSRIGKIKPELFNSDI